MITRYESYKPSGIEWIGDIPRHWTMKKISHGFNKIGSGTTPTAGSPEYYQDGLYNWLQTGDLLNGEIYTTSKKITQKALDDYPTLKFYKIDSLVIAMYGATIGKTGILKIEATTNQACCVLSEASSFLSKYVFYWFNANKDIVVSLSYGGGQPNISQEIIRSIRIPCPPLKEQKEIVRYLEQKTYLIDKLLDNKEQLIELLKEEKIVILNKAVTGEGKTWQRKKLKYVAKLKSGESITSDSIRQEGAYAVYGGNGLRGFTSTYTHEGTFILIGRQGALCGNINYSSGNFFASEHAVVVSILDNSEYFWLGELLRSMNLNQYSIASAQPGLSVERIENLTIPYPSIKEQREIVVLIKREALRIGNLISKIEIEIELIKEYRTALVSEVTRGKQKVI